MIANSLRTALVCLVLSAPACLADPVTFETATGPQTLPEPPHKIAALDVAAIDTLTALGVTPAGIVSPLFVDYLDPEMEGAEVIGTMFEPDFERIAALQPDLIVLGSRSLSQASALSGLGPVADMSVGDDAMADGLARLAAYGALTGTQARASELAEALDQKVASVRALVAGRGNALIVMTNGPKLSVFGAASRFGWLHTALDWPQAVDDIGESRHGEAVTFEYIAEADPDTLIVIDRGQVVGGGLAGAKATLDNELMHQTKAWKTGHIIYLSPSEVYVASGGIQALNITLDQLTDALKSGS